VPVTVAPETAPPATDLPAAATDEPTKPKPKRRTKAAATDEPTKPKPKRRAPARRVSAKPAADAASDAPDSESLGDGVESAA
jgi:hypothetical protein